ncbi:MAG: hypothetical protein HY248_01100 [Fimbriimonas ginsengisoli]|nr:hypothetical protein [Fimbriimonas ginsengisoli]
MAVHIYRRKHHDLPDTLELLVKDGILKAIPIDPFDDNPVHYSKERGILWSVGPDGKDDDGDSSFQHPAQEGGPPGAPKDIVVTLNPSPAP